jgi:nitrous oxidase accessory protein NosD
MCSSSLKGQQFFQASPSSFHSQADQLKFERLLDVQEGDYKLFTLDLQSLDAYMQAQSGTFFVNLHIDQVWNWTLKLESAPSMGGYDYAYNGVVVPNGGCRLYVTKDFILGHLSLSDETLHFTLLQHELGASYQGVFVLFSKATPMLSIPPYENSQSPITGKVEIGIDIDNQIYNEFGGNMALITAAVQVQMDEVQRFYRDQHTGYSSNPFSVELIYYNRGPYPKPTPYDFIGSTLVSTHLQIRNNWNRNQPCIPKDVILQLMTHPHPAYGQISMDTGGTGNICESTTPTIFINHRPDTTSPHRLTPQYNPVFALTIAHELGHLMTKTGGHLEEYPFCPASETNLCNTVPSPIMCSYSGLARGLHEAYFSNCSRQRIHQTLTNLGPVCFSDERPVPALPCPAPCVIPIQFNADNLRPSRQCGDRGEINYTVEICNSCESARNFNVVLRNRSDAQQILSLDVAFNPQSLPDAAFGQRFETGFSDWQPGECRYYSFSALLNDTYTGTSYNTRIEVPTAPGQASPRAENIQILQANYVTVSGGTLQNPNKLSTLNFNGQYSFLHPSTACNTMTPVAIAVSGVLEIDLANLPPVSGAGSMLYCLKNAKIKMLPGSRIIISGAGGTLSMENTEIFSCTNMWEQFIVKSGVELIMDHCRWEDGIQALTLENGAIAQIRDNDFLNNRIGVYIPPGSTESQDIDVPEFEGNRFETVGDGLKTPFAGQKALAGVWIYGVRDLQIGISDANENNFAKLHNGVVAFNSNLSVKNSFFEGIHQETGANAPAFSGYGIYSVGNTAYYRLLDVKGFGKYGTPVFRDCATAIFTDKMAAYIEHCNMEQVQQGIHLQNARFRRLDVSRNNISASRTGINLFQNTPVRCTVDNNDVLVAGTAYSSGTGIRMEESPFGVQNYQYYTLQNNTVRMLSGAEGISLQAGRYVQLYNNTVQLSETGLPQNGITLWGAGNALVRCNTLLGPKNYNSAFPNRGIAGLGAYGALISCNTTDYLRTGILFDGMADATALRGNNLYRHHTGLQILDNGHIGEQVHHGNRWFGPFTESGAKHLALAFEVVEQSRFRVDPAASSGQPYAYEPSWSAVGPWFIPDPVNETDIFKCLASTYDACQTAAPPLWVKTETDALDDKLAQSALQSPQFAQELGWTGRRHLYSRIVENNLPLQPGTFVRSFYTTTSGDVIAKLQQTQQSLRAAYQAESPAGLLLDQQNAALKEGLSQLHRNSLLQQQATTASEQTALTSERALLRSNLHATLAYADALAEDAADAAYVQLGTAAAINATVAATAVYEQNEKHFNDLHIAWQQAESLTPAQQDALKNIAFQCPWRGGDAVFYARSLYALLEPDALYDDALLCSSTGQSRALIPQDLTVVAGFELYPNPAGDYIIIRTSGIEDSARASVVLYDLMGREILHTAVVGNSDFVLNTEQVHTGLFWAMLFVDGQRVDVRKVVIKR